MSNDDTVDHDVEIGSCLTCGQELINYRGDIWHPHDCGPCPASIYGRPGAVNFSNRGGLTNDQ